MKRLFVLFALVFTLQGCIFVVGAAAGAAGAAAVYDHRSVEKIFQDQQTSHAVVNKINSIPGITDSSHIEVTCFNQVILLTGEASSPEIRDQADAMAHSVPNVQHVYNELTVKGPTSSLTRASDSWVTAKIKTRMLATKGLQSGTIKVVTENGTVYLMGVVSQKQANIAVSIARQISGVQRVVKIFQYSEKKPPVVPVEQPVTQSTAQPAEQPIIEKDN